MSARDLAAFAADIAAEITDIWDRGQRANRAYYARLWEIENAPPPGEPHPCRCGNPLPDGRYKCDACRAETAVANRERKKAQQRAKRAAAREAKP